MFALLYQYLIEQGEVFIASVGRLQMIAQPASYEVANQQLLAPRHIVQVQADAESPNLQPQIAFISRQLNIPEEEAYDSYHEYCRQLQADVSKERMIDLEGWGRLQKSEEGSYSFINAPALELYTQPVAAHRVIRKGAEHSMMVGTTETTSTIMREMLEEQPVIQRRSLWWIAASIVGLAAIVLIYLRKMEYL
jgi:hypothetical protein